MNFPEKNYIHVKTAVFEKFLNLLKIVIFGKLKNFFVQTNKNLFSLRNLKPAFQSYITLMK